MNLKYTFAGHFDHHAALNIHFTHPAMQVQWAQYTESEE